MSFIKFNEDKVDSFLFMELSDVARTLTKNKQLEVEYGYKSYYDPHENKIFISRFWDDYSTLEKRFGLFSDVFLTSISSGDYFDKMVAKELVEKSDARLLVSFTRQLFVLLEDLRLEDIFIKKRPGTRKIFAVRRQVFRRYFSSQLNVNTTRGVYTDALLNLIYLLLSAESPFVEYPSIHAKIDPVIPFVQTEVTKVFDAKSTRDIAKITFTVMEVLEELLQADMLNLYFYISENVYKKMDDGLTYDDLKRRNGLKNNDVLDKEKEGDEDVHSEKLPTWHQETEDTTKSFLKFDLEQGTQTDLIGEGVREGEAGDQALAVVQGKSGKSKHKDFSEVEAVEANDAEALSGAANDEKYGRANKFAVPIHVRLNQTTIAEKERYDEFKTIIMPYQKKLKQMIQKTLEHKKILPREDLHIGRLNKKLIRYFTDENPRLFYKKNQPSPEIDAVFSLLVDCSASMYDKMDQTKLGITLFHEALSGVGVPHNIVGFWEDSSDATEVRQPNCFKTVVDFANFADSKSGPKIMQLEPEEDNRDGFAIRMMCERLLQRHEKQKFLLVFSDGEPAAFDYVENGIIDTHEAVVNGRKKGIEIINVFLANGEITESQQTTIKNIYGKYSILVPVIDDLPDILFPLLKKLLLRSI
ncbi:VWA domain-containing protein [Schinkia azotoformans]|uniref:von Willebrand factor type A n=1 Tax=Schinkia azotoformans LMG 9581 TaxID=1131731 RepID=K6DNZ9_SCHAZ|nr:VWA domain-containing protein [Schinkia azotoformans]EKN70029.1 von Willebrand factor type A [Schinkia azotoformans LMG 9581]MEC1641132.1 VWA domain-containing protein [Schinkia azotoformans]MEC1947642.1 VWA domain-containing protein [Schinkia azotoformans]